jgi:hypothetical protein
VRALHAAFELGTGGIKRERPFGEEAVQSTAVYGRSDVARQDQSAGLDAPRR